MKNTIKLQIEYMSKLMVDRGKGVGGIVNQMANNLSPIAQEARQFVEDSIAAVRYAHGSPYHQSTDEEIAGVILQEIEKKREATKIQNR